MQLYGFQINEQSVSMQRKAYYCKLIADTDQLARQIKYYPLYEEHRTIKGVFENLLKDREVLYAPLFRYVSDELQAHGIYNYDSQRIIDACDAVSGKYISVYMDIQEQCCEIVGALEEEMQLRQLRKDTRGRIGAIGSGVGGLAVGMLKAGTLNITSDTTSEYYYVGKTKDNRPDGFGMIFGMSTGSGTYALADGFMIHYIGDFKNGAYDGFGALFSADEYDLSGMINNIVQSGEITSDEVLENAVEYLFNYVSYEGHFKDGKMNGKGNEFSFPNVEVGLPFDFNNDPIDGYRYYNIYPDVIMGEYKNNALTGMVKEYWHNHLWYSGEMDDGQESGKGAWYYNNGQVMYEGEFKKGKQSGKGSYYDENGNLIYSGEWENGDYAH